MANETKTQDGGRVFCLNKCAYAVTCERHYTHPLTGDPNYGWEIEE